MTPSEETIRLHLTQGCFELGVSTGKWSSHSIDFPTLDVRVFGTTNDIALRFNLTDYPMLAPAGQLWNIEAGGPLEVSLWPTGGRADGVFRKDWSLSNGGAPYFPLDRVALQTHETWMTEKAPEQIWTPSKTIYDYLLFVHLVLRGATIPTK